jgi:small subunit ribosomal protein S12e
MAEAVGGVIAYGLRQINLSGRVAKGFNCTVKAIIKGKAKIVFLADDCDDKNYKALITGLCRKNHVKLQAFPNKRDLGIALGLVQIKGDGTARGGKHQRGCGACAVTKYASFDTPAVEEFRNLLEPPPEASG